MTLSPEDQAAVDDAVAEKFGALERDFKERQDRLITGAVHDEQLKVEDRRVRRLQAWVSIFGVGLFAAIAAFAVWLTDSVKGTAKSTAIQEANDAANAVLRDEGLRLQLANNVDRLQQDALKKIEEAITAAATARAVAEQYEHEMATARQQSQEIAQFLEKNTQITREISNALNAQAGLEEIVEKVLQNTNFQSELLKAQVFPTDLVIASTVPCPSLSPGSWSEYTDARGRMILGANPDGSHGYKPRPAGGIGGEEDVTLTEAQMPKHDHAQLPHNVLLRISGGGNTTGPANMDTTPSEPNIIEAGFTQPRGESQPHNNMPPYIALYFCKKG